MKRHAERNIDFGLTGNVTEPLFTAVLSLYITSVKCILMSLRPIHFLRGLLTLSLTIYVL